MEQEHTCCFTGHRKLSLQDYFLMRHKLRELLLKLLEQGFTTFLAGGALGFDTLAAQEVLDLRDSGYPHLTLVLALPCREQDRGWSTRDREIYREVLQRADEVHYVSEVYTRGCMYKRNRYLVEHSSCCICCLSQDKGGTAYTVAYAEKRGLPVYNLCDR